MKKYADVVEERYNDRELKISPWDNVYSELNKIGLYQSYKLKKNMLEVFHELKELGIDILNSRILDVGCGEGAFLRYISEIKGNCEELYGVDMSEERIKKADKINDKINYFIGDMVEFRYNEIKFDIIVSVNSFMHLNTREEIKKTLENISSMLNENGIFIWYDAYWETHFKNNATQESCGFNLNEMNYFTKEVGLNNIITKSVGKYILNDISLSTAYLGNNFEPWVIDMMEEKLPGLPVSYLTVYQK